MDSILTSNALSPAPSINPGKKQNLLGRVVQPLGMEVASVYTDAKNPNPPKLQFVPFFDPRMFRGNSGQG